MKSWMRVAFGEIILGEVGNIWLDEKARRGPWCPWNPVFMTESFLSKTDKTARVSWTMIMTCESLLFSEPSLRERANWFQLLVHTSCAYLEITHCSSVRILGGRDFSFSWIHTVPLYLFISCTINVFHFIINALKLYFALTFAGFAYEPAHQCDKPHNITPLDMA